jgi:hypothetical protein
MPLEQLPTRSHPQLEYMVECEHHKLTRYTDDANQAAAFAFFHACTGCEVDFNVLVYGEDGARFYGGDDAVERYKEDPDCSTFEQWTVSVNFVGRVA